MMLPVALSRLALHSTLHSALTLALLSGVAVAAETKTGVKPDPARGQQVAATCMACHTADGSRGAPVNPILQGQHPEYLVKQLVDFKSGKRNNAVMMGMAATIAEDDLKHIAAFYSSKQAKAGAARSKETLALGERIWRGGLLAKAVPACSGCHSPNGAGLPALYPRIASQHGEYTEAQLLAFRSGLRANSPQMSAIAAKLSDVEIKAVADYAAGLQ